MDEHTEANLLEIAEAMHAELCGCDDKTCGLTNEIYEWLCNGDTPEAYTVADVNEYLREWREYSAA